MTDQRFDLSVTKLKKTFTRGPETLSILNDVHLEMNMGDSTAIIGPSGSGKSTLLYAIAGLEPPDAGSIELLGIQPWELKADELAQFRNRHIGFIFQDHHLLPQCSVLENVLIPVIASQPATKEVDDYARELLDQVGLSSRLSHLPGELSGGERQRVAICRALVNQPELVAADEPTGNLDPNTASIVAELLLKLVNQQKTMLLCVTHSHQLASLFPSILELKQEALVPWTPASTTAT